MNYWCFLVHFVFEIKFKSAKRFGIAVSQGVDYREKDQIKGLLKIKKNYFRGNLIFCCTAFGGIISGRSNNPSSRLRMRVFYLLCCNLKENKKTILEENTVNSKEKNMRNQYLFVFVCFFRFVFVVFFGLFCFCLFVFCFFVCFFFCLFVFWGFFAENLA